MKKICYILLSLFIISCSKVEPDISDNVLSTKIIINNVVSLYISELTKSNNGNIYYGFEIDSLHINKYYEPYFNDYICDTTYCHYAEGIFTDINNLIINLDANRQYCFKCTIIQDNIDYLYKEGNYVFDPFVAVKSSNLKQALITNEFIYNSEKTLDLENNSNTIRVNNGEYKWNAQVIRYFSKTIDNHKRTTSEPIIFNMERRNFGLHIVANPPSEGQIHIYQNYGFPKYDYIINAGDSTFDKTCIYALDLINNFQTIYLKVEWIKDNGVVIDCSPDKFRAYNNTMTNIDIKLSQKTKSNEVYINYGNNSMTQTTITVQ